ncbi:uncharacterized protein JCM15063_003739 [Sporobolomyces koalae]|uniref:uncharacterized protein n=1 Tax=Sporobolomyces koalae TaxID=500713 RepID=UPI003175EC38
MLTRRPAVKWYFPFRGDIQKNRDRYFAWSRTQTRHEAFSTCQWRDRIFVGLGEIAESGFKEPSGGYFQFEPTSGSTEGGGSRLSPGKQTLEHLVARNEEAAETQVQRLNIRRATRTPGQATTDESQSTLTDDRTPDKSTVSGLGTTPSY